MYAESMDRSLWSSLEMPAFASMRAKWLKDCVVNGAPQAGTFQFEVTDFGVDDIGGTYHNEKVVHAAGAITPDKGSEQHLLRMIKGAGKVPVRSNAGYGSISNCQV